MAVCVRVGGQRRGREEMVPGARTRVGRLLVMASAASIRVAVWSAVCSSGGRLLKGYILPGKDKEGAKGYEPD